MPDSTIERIGKALHVFHGLGYCSQGPHAPQGQYHCWEEARVILDAIAGDNVPDDYPGTTDARTLSAKSTKKVSP